MAENKEYWFDKLLSQPLYDFSGDKDQSNKKKLVNDLSRYTLIRTQSMFEYSGLPETIPKRYLEFQLQRNGFSVFTQVNGKLYAFHAGLGGEWNEYYEPTIAIVNNPYLKFNKQLTIGKDCVLVQNDAFRFGLFPLISRYNTLIAENMISLRIASINKRLFSMITVGDDGAKEAAELYLSRVERGELAALLDQNIINNIKAQPYQTGSDTSITSMIELHQYLSSKLDNELGLQANYNMKRESLSAQELSLNDDTMLPLLDHLLEERQRTIGLVNEMFGTSISVDFSSSWKNKREEIALEKETMKNNVHSSEQNEAPSKEPSEEGGEDDVGRTEKTE